MTTILEANRLTMPDTRSAKPLDRLIKGGPQVYIGGLTSGQSQLASVANTAPEFHLAHWKKIVGQLDSTQHTGRVYLVTIIHHGQMKGKSSPQQGADTLAAKHREHREYLQRVSTEGTSPLITPAVAKKAWDFWQVVRKAVGTTIPIPSAGTGPDGVMFYSWDNGEHHLEAEFYPNRETEFFYRNRRTGELWGDDYSKRVLSADLLTKLRLFLI